MKRFLLFTLLLFHCICCFSQLQSYAIRGTLFDVDLNGERIDLVELGEQTNTTIQNTSVRNNTFLFSGSIDSPKLCMLVIENHKVLFVLENTEIKVDIYRDSTRVYGTTVNDELQKLIQQSNTYRKQLTELFGVFQALPENSSEKEQLMQRFDEMEKHWHSEIIVKYIERNINNPAGMRAFKSLFSDLTLDELSSIIAKVDSVNIHDQAIQKAIKHLDQSDAIH